MGKKLKGKKKSKPNGKTSDTAALNASEAAAIVASSRVTNLSMSWIDKVRELRPGLNKKMNLESKEQHEIEGEPPLPRLADNAVNSSDSSDSESRKPRVTTKLTAVDWAKSLFGESAGVQKAIAETEGGHKVSDALKQLRQRPLNLEMIPNVLLNFEPFWRTESLEKIEAAWKIERPSLIETYLSKHKAATRAAKKTLTSGSSVR